MQGCARDLLAAALVRFEARGLQVVHHAHDEITIEVPAGSISEPEMLAILLEPPAWATGLPLNGKVRTGVTYLDAPATAEPPQPETEEEIVEAAVDAFVADMPELVDADGAPIDPPKPSPRSAALPICRSAAVISITGMVLRSMRWATTR